MVLPNFSYYILKVIKIWEVIMNQTLENRIWNKPDISASGIFGKGWELIKKYFIELFIITIIVTAACIPIGLANNVSGYGAGIAFMKLFAFAYFLFVFSAIDYGTFYAFVRGARGCKPDVTDIYKSKENYMNIVLAKLVTMFIIGFGIALFIIPGIYLACKLVFVPYLVVDKNMEITDAIRESWKMSEGYGWVVFRMGLICIPVIIAGILFCGVGVIFSIMLIRASFAKLYASFEEKEEIELNSKTVSDMKIETEVKDNSETDKDNKEVQEEKETKDK